eukprot:1209648-Prymnesium_polylepis.2
MCRVLAHGAQPGMLAPSFVPFATVAADTGTRVALKPGVTVQSLACPAEFVGSSFCTVPNGLADSSPSLRGDFGRIGGPDIVLFHADDP